jgi:adenine/guanine phosphoribosyltransferase-like PRPP-binding protein
MSRFIRESEFLEVLREGLQDIPEFDIVTGPGRSGAIAGVYTSYFTGKPFLPYKQLPPPNLKVLVVDTAMLTGRTIRKALKYYRNNNPVSLCCFNEPPRVQFWYEKLK